MTETFQLRNDPPKPAPWRAESALPARQGKLFVGCSDLPGQTSLFDADGPRLPAEPVKTFPGLRYQWEDQPQEEGAEMPGTDISRGTRVTSGQNSGVCLGMSDCGQFIGVKLDHLDTATEYPIDRFASLFRRS